MNTPVTALDQQYSDPAAVAVSWPETCEILESAELYWISTVRPDGRPHVTPVVAAWIDGAVCFSTGAGEQKFANLRANPHVVLATVSGAWLARRHAARRGMCLGATAGALLVIAGAHLLPDAWAGARQAALPGWAVPAAAVAAFAAAGALIRRGCACQAEREAAGGAGAAGALAGHRLLEGAALALAGSVLVTAALAVHALAEGLAAAMRPVPGRPHRPGSA